MPTDVRKRSITVSLDPEVVDWVQERVGPGKEFASVSHAVGRGLALLRDLEGGRSARKK